MNIGAITCLAFAALFLLLALVFTFLKERGAMLISGFNTLPKEEREQYDKRKMSADQRNQFILWTAIFLCGALLSYFTSPYIAIVAFAIWLILFFKEVHLDTDRAFGKYRKQ